MSDYSEQLAALRKRIAPIDDKYAVNRGNATPVTPKADYTPARIFVEELLSGEVVETEHGQHFETEKLYERHRRHGSMGISDLEDMAPDLLHCISEGEVPKSSCERWAFLDTETTGLAGGTGTYPFLIGVGRIAADGFRVRQFFMRDYAEEASQLTALEEHLKQFDVLITYNGKTYDQPLLETRYRMVRKKPPFARLQHLDLLYGARRLWRLRYDSCRLVDLENQVLGVERQGDLPGALIPYVYFEYLHTKQAHRLVPIFHHNATDILTLACLTGIVPRAFQDPCAAEYSHGSEMVGIARWLLRSERHDDAAALMRRAVERGLRDELLFRTMWDLALIEKKKGRDHAALAIWTDLTASPNAFRVGAFEELSKFYEHKERNFAMALDMVESAMTNGETPDLRRRHERIAARLARPKTKRLALG